MLFNPHRISHTQLQAEFYRQCYNKGINIFCEYYYDDCRFDAVVYHKNQVLILIEIKNYKKKRAPNLTTKQYAKYSRYNLPLYYIVNIDDIEPIVEKIKQYLDFL